MVEDPVTCLARYFGLSGPVPCVHLRARKEELAHDAGFRPKGIVKGSPAARSMSKEAKRHGGCVPSIMRGGMVASMQSIGSEGATNPHVYRALRQQLRLNGLLIEDDGDDVNHSDQQHQVCLPSYFATVGTPPQLCEDYAVGGYNCRMAEKMLGDSVLHFCRNNTQGCSQISRSTTFRITKFQRIENVEVFRRYKCYEAFVENKLRHQDSRQSIPETLPDWLTRLSRKNGLPASANATYLLHGTKSSYIPSIVQNGLKTRYSLATSPVYGRGLYFTDSSCKANNHATTEGCILVCRVVLGKIEILSDTQRNRLFPSHGYHSAMAMRDVTPSPHPAMFTYQLHNEYIVFNENACYPEFVITYELA